MADLQVNGVTKQFATRGEPLTVLRDVSFELNQGQNAAILGPSGSGKSTFLHMLGTLDRPTSGTILFQSEDPFDMSEAELARFRNRNIGFIFQEHHLLPQLSVLENVLVPTIADGRATDQQVERAKDLIQRVGLADRTDHRPAELSGGERQRVAVARALIHHPKLVLADEPTGSLDRTNAQRIGQLLLDLQQQENVMMVVVTHSTQLAELCQRTFVIDDGQLKAA